MVCLMKRADHVIVCTPHLEEFVRKHNTQTTDISSTINTDVYLPANPYSNDRTLTLGWSGSHSTVKYLHLLDQVLRDLSGELEFRLKVIGAPDFDIDGVDVSAQDWNEASEVEDLQEIDIGLYPLPIEEWVLGKSGLKALQYMALGIPTIATRVGANPRIIRDGENGFLVNDPEEWRAAISRLARDTGLRRRIGAEGTKTVVDHFSVRANQGAYLRVLDTVFAADGLA